MSESTTDSTATTQRDVSSPYHLYPNDNPGALITSVLLTNENYSEWSTELRNSLQAKQKIGFIDGTISKQPTTALTYLGGLLQIL